MTSLALGTVQFGMNYGIAGRGEAVPEAEVRDILSVAWDGGIRTLDTASAYGDIEQRLASLVGDRPFRVVSKIPALPQTADVDSAASFVRKAASTIRARLGERLETLLFHRADDLDGPFGNAMWEAARESVGSTVRLGVSCYAPTEVEALSNRFPVDVTQIPGSALDQRLRDCPLDECEVHLRSIFLQGLLLLSQEEAAAHAPHAANVIERWHRWCDERGIAPLRAALGIAKGLPGVRHCVVGVDRAQHLEEILNSWSDTPALQAPGLATNDIEVIDPRRWRPVRAAEHANH